MSLVQLNNTDPAIVPVNTDKCMLAFIFQTHKAAFDHREWNNILKCLNSSLLPLGAQRGISGPSNKSAFVWLLTTAGCFHITKYCALLQMVNTFPSCTHKHTLSLKYCRCTAHKSSESEISDVIIVVVSVQMSVYVFLQGASLAPNATHLK